MNESESPGPFFAALEALEWDQTLALVAHRLSTPAGEREFGHVAPGTDRVDIESALAEVGEAMAFLRAAATGAARRIEFRGLPDVSGAAQKLRIEGAVLDPREILELALFLDRASEARSNLTAGTERFPLLAAYAARIGDFRFVLKEISGKVQPDGSLADSASPHLHRIRKDIEKQKKAIQDSLERFLRANRDEGVLQDEFVTVRNDRFVVPVLTGQRRKLAGVIHGASSSGQTLFLEPLETIDLNNEIVRLQDEEAREVHRILRDLTEKLRSFASPVREAAVAMAQLEVLFAKGKFGVDFDCTVPRLCAETPRIELRNARHPALMEVLRLSGRSVVPFSLTLDGQTRTLLISGPNTGGKTVTLKTIGLIALMTQAGLPVPSESAELPIFSEVLADIGDRQSIEQNLSTFSAHVARLREMALTATPDSLVLLDEIGSATDPDEGGALGVALVDHFRCAGAFTIASTHLTALKIYGASTPSVMNASMGFDQSTLAPTWRLQVGLPGKSAGLDIAARLGMPESILRRARAGLDQKDRDLSQLIAELHAQLEAATTERAELERERSRLSAREREIRLEWERKGAAKLQDLELRFEVMRREMRERADAAVARIEEIAERRKALDQASREASKLSREMGESWKTQVLGEVASAAPAGFNPITPGSRVRLKGIREIAKVTRLLDRARIEVAVGFVKMQAEMTEVEEVLAESQQAEPRLPKGVRLQAGPQLNPGAREINVIGKTADEASDEVERFLDSAVMATAARVRIVHGHGMGILRRAVHELLKSSPHVDKFYPAEQFEGGSGATIVELRA